MEGGEQDPFAFNVGIAPEYVPTPGRDRAYTAPNPGTPALPSSLTPHPSQEPGVSPATGSRARTSSTMNEKGDVGEGGGGSTHDPLISKEAREAVNATFPSYKVRD